MVCVFGLSSRQISVRKLPQGRGVAFKREVGHDARRRYVRGVSGDQRLCVRSYLRLSPGFFGSLDSFEENETESNPEQAGFGPDRTMPSFLTNNSGAGSAVHPRGDRLFQTLPTRPNERWPLLPHSGPGLVKGGKGIHEVLIAFNLVDLPVVVIEQALQQRNVSVLATCRR